MTFAKRIFSKKQSEEDHQEGKSAYKYNKFFHILCHAILILLSLAAILPFLLLFSSSLTDEGALMRYGYFFIPRVFSLQAYEFLFVTNVNNIMRAYGISFFVTFTGTSLSLLIAPALAYPLSRSDYPRRRIVLFFVFFTMLFNGGLVPQYIMWTQVFGLRNHILALIFPNLLMNGFIIMLLKNNFQTNIHPALIEAAKIDGAGEFFIYRKIVLPLSLPILATVGLMVAVGYWNDWMNGLYYISDPRLFSLQQLLNTILMNIQAIVSMADVGVGADLAAALADMPSIGIRMAMAVIGVIPIMVLYPFFQKYFIKGLSLGGVKE